MNKPLIGLTSYQRNEDNRFTLPATYAEAIERSNGIPFVLTPTTETPDELIGILDGFVLTGGADLCPSTYGGRHDESVYGVNEERDQYELRLARALVERSVPVLAICRGIQVLNVAMGGTLVEDIPKEYGDSVVHRGEDLQKVDHPVSLSAESRLAEIIGSSEFICPSYHHQSVRVPAPGFDVVAKSADGVIEAIESQQYPGVIAVQWHPEFVAENDELQQRLFDVLIDWSGNGIPADLALAKAG